jgi:pimeloyl-ACP methyl ester carboxylesterase
MRIMCIHGAWSSPVSFNHLSTRVKGSWNRCTYSPDEDLASIIGRLDGECDRPCLVIGHSLGGLIALNLHDNPNVLGIVTMASPLAGLQIGYLARYMSRSGLLSDVASDSRIMRATRARDYGKPVLHLVSTRGFNPFVYEDNDGVVPLKSQRDWSCGRVVDVEANHYEILQHHDTIAELSRFVGQVSQ